MNAYEKARERLNMNHAQFAKALGVSVRTVHHWEAGTRKPRAVIDNAIILLIEAERAKPKPKQEQKPARIMDDSFWDSWE